MDANSALHLRVIPHNGHQHGNESLFNPVKTDVAWNDDFSAFRPIALRWWDDASYAAYQAEDQE